MILQLALLAALQQQAPAATSDQSYLFFVASTGTDEVALLRFRPSGMSVEHHTPFKLVPGDAASSTEVYSIPHFLFDTLPVVFDSSLLLSSAHGFASSALMSGPRRITIGPDGRSYFVTSDRGLPAGELLNVRIARDSGLAFQPIDTIVGREPLGSGLGAAHITPDGAFAWVTVAAGVGTATGGVAVVYLSSMTEVAMIRTCAGASGGELAANATRHYSLCASEDALIEIDATKMQVVRRVALVVPGEARCVPSAMALRPDGSRIFVACHALNQVVEVDGRTGNVLRRITVGRGPRELALSPDGNTLVVVNEGGRTISLLDLSTGAAAPSRSRVVIGSGGWFAYVHTIGSASQPARTDVYEIGPLVLATGFVGSPQSGAAASAQLAAVAGGPASVAVSGDGKYAFVSIGRSAAATGTIEVIDLVTQTVVGRHQFGKELAGVAFWKVSP